MHGPTSSYVARCAESPGTPLLSSIVLERLWNNCTQEGGEFFALLKDSVHV
jgi:hypothetical protein